jgi:hypothetical protein
MTTNKPAVFTPAAYERLKQLHDEVRQEIENQLVLRRSVPGDEVVEVTGSDVEELVRSMRVSFDGAGKRRLAYGSFIAKIYAAIGITIVAIGLLYPYLRDIAAEPFRLALLGTGVAMVGASLTLLAVLEHRLVMRISFLREKQLQALEQEVASSKLPGMSIELRPWVGIGPPTMREAEFSEPLQCDVVIKNTGKTPAIITRLIAYMLLAGPEEDIYNFVDQSDFMREAILENGMLAPGDAFTIKVSDEISLEEAANVGKHIMVRVLLNYTDLEGYGHTTRSLFRYDSSLGTFGAREPRSPRPDRKYNAMY